MNDAGVDQTTKIYLFWEMLNPALNNKLTQLIPQPNTLEGMVEKCRDFDNNWRAFAKPMGSRSGTGRNPRIREIQTESQNPVTTVQAVRRFQSKKRGPLSDQEKKYRRDNNLCLYCGKPGHMAAEC